MTCKEEIPIGHTDTQHDYFNSGIILMDLERARALVKPEKIFAHVEKHVMELPLLTRMCSTACTVGTPCHRRPGVEL